MWKEPIRPADMRLFRRFVGSWLRNNVTGALDPRDEFPLEEWLAGTTYNGRESDHFRSIVADYCRRRRIPPRAYATHLMGLVRNTGRGALYAGAKAFLKEEFYRDYDLDTPGKLKAPRFINARTKYITAAVGPIVKKMESITYELRMRQGAGPRVVASDLPWFIKHVPVAERPLTIEKLRQFITPRSTIIATDHTAFEAHFTAELMAACEFQLYHWLARRNPTAERVITDFERICTGLSVADAGHFHILIEATRRSGDVTTSLGNGFTNLMLMLFCASRVKCEAWGFVEGDDGLFVLTPSCGVLPSIAQFRALGMDLKLETCADLSEASFCGQVYVPGEMRVVTDPLWFLAKSAWYLGSDCTQVSDRVALQLLRARAMSGLAQYAGCPVVHAWCLRALSDSIGVTPRYNLRGTTPYAALDLGDISGKIQRLAAEPVTPAARLLVEKVYGLSVTAQLKAEDDVLAGRPLELPVPKGWLDFCSAHCLNVDC